MIQTHQTTVCNADRSTTFLMRIPPGCQLVLHPPHCDTLSISVVRGEATLCTVGGQHVSVKSLFLQPTTRYTIRNVGEDEVQLYVIATNAQKIESVVLK